MSYPGIRNAITRARTCFAALQLRRCGRRGRRMGRLARACKAAASAFGRNLFRRPGGRSSRCSCSQSSHSWTRSCLVRRPVRARRVQRVAAGSRNGPLRATGAADFTERHERDASLRRYGASRLLRRSCRPGCATPAQPRHDEGSAVVGDGRPPRARTRVCLVWQVVVSRLCTAWRRSRGHRALR
jgi:hypothetical protein